jgi:F420-0:gamma-glutamyl ligase
LSWTKVVVNGRSYFRCPVRTRWLNAHDELVMVLRQYTRDREPGDTIAISEKVVVLLSGRAVPINTVRIAPMARLLAKLVRPRPGSRGLSIPAKMQYVAQQVGWPRLLTAACASAVTRPFGVHGVFYRVAGTVARDIDGGRPPYAGLLFPPLPEAIALAICTKLDQLLGVGVAIVDLNDFGGSVRAVSPRSLPEPTLRSVLADNPLGQRRHGTPFALIRPS